MREAGKQSNFSTNLAKIASTASIEFSYIQKDIIAYTANHKNNYAAIWASTITQGMVAKAASQDDNGNTWLKNLALVKSGRYITALKMCTNKCPTREAMARGRAGNGVTCSK